MYVPPKPTPITLLYLDRKIHEVRKEIDLLLRATELKMDPVASMLGVSAYLILFRRSGPWRVLVILLAGRILSIARTPLLCRRSSLSVNQHSIEVILDRLLEFRSDAITYFEKEG